MRRWVCLLLLSLLLVACSAKTGSPPTVKADTTKAPTGDSALTDRPPATPALEANCPPPPPPEPVHSQPPPIYVNFGVREENPTLAPGQPLHITAYLKNVAPYAIVLDPQVPVVQLRRQQNVMDAPIWSVPLTDWAGITLQPGDEVTQTGEWPGGETGYYLLDFDRIHFTVACIHDNPTTSGGGAWVHVLLPTGQALVGSVTPHTAVTVDEITVRVDSVVMDATKTQVTLWVSRISAPADLSVTVYRDGKTPLEGAGLSNRDAQGGGVLVFDDRAPVPVGTKSLTVEVSEIGLTTPGVGMVRVHGPWRITVPLATPAPTDSAANPGVLVLSDFLTFSPPSGYVLNKELSTESRSLWMGPKSGWMITAGMELWTTNEQSITGASLPAPDLGARKEMIIKGDRAEYFGLLTWGADGTGGGASLFWNLVVGGSKGILRFGCSGSRDYDALEVMCKDQIAKVRVTDLGAVVKM